MLGANVAQVMLKSVAKVGEEVKKILNAEKVQNILSRRKKQVL